MPRFVAKPFTWRRGADRLAHHDSARRMAE